MAVLREPAYYGKKAGRDINRLKDPDIRILDLENEAAKIEYPCKWIYKVIGADFISVHQAVSQVLEEREYYSEESNMSSKGSYVSVKVELIVENEDVRNSIFSNLKEHKDIRMVL